MNDSIEYVPLPLTAQLLKQFEANMEVFARNGDPRLFQEMAAEVYGIPDREKSRVVIDLLTMLSACMRSVAEYQLPKLDD